MARSTDHTLLARLGFADLDRREPDHDLACRYVLDNAERIVRSLWPAKESESLEIIWKDAAGAYIARGSLKRSVIIREATQEVHLSKGNGQYRTTVGFVDALFAFRSTSCMRGIRRYLAPLRAADWEATKREFLQSGLWSQAGNEECGEWITDDLYDHVAIEIKAAPVPISESLRQIKLYRAYMPSPCRWILATCYPITEGEHAVLTNHGIWHIRLGDAFTTWKAQQSADLHAGIEL